MHRLDHIKASVLKNASGPNSTGIHWLFLDGPGIARVHFYAGRDPMLNDRAQSTQAIIGTYHTAQRLIERFKPVHVVVAFDGIHLLRKKLYEPYLSRRQRANDELRRQEEWLPHFAKTLGWKIALADNYEVMDLAASAARRVKERDETIAVVTNDKRAMMLLGDHVAVIMRAGVIWDRIEHRDVFETWGVIPEKVGQVMALSGYENIPGIFRLGRITAAKLVNTYGSAERAFENLESLTPALGDKLRKQKLAYDIGSQLVPLAEDAPIDLSSLERADAPFDREAIERFCKRHGMERTLLREIDRDYPVELWDLAAAGESVRTRSNAA